MRSILKALLFLLATTSQCYASGFHTIHVDHKLNPAISWSQRLPGLYKNELPSEADLACDKVGGRLPTRLEYSSLMGDFGFEIGGYGWPLLTDAGIEEFVSIFGSDAPGMFWTSTASNDDIPFTFDLIVRPKPGESRHGSISFQAYRNSRIAVRCVR